MLSGGFVDSSCLFASTIECQRVAKKKSQKDKNFREQYVVIKPAIMRLEIYKNERAFSNQSEAQYVINLAAVYSLKRTTDGLVFIVTHDADYLLRTKNDPTWGDLLKKHALTNSSRMMVSLGKDIYDSNPTYFKEYVEQHCVGTDTLKVTRSITLGAELIKEIYSRSELSWNALTSSFETSDDDVVHLIWLFMAKAGLYGEFFSSGVFRIDDTDGKIFKFLNSHRGAYSRISTHYVERIDETYRLHEAQRGIDMKRNEGYKLPARKNTVLFFRLGDGTTIIKIENAGCPPFWEKGFRSTKNAMEFGRHSTDFFRTRLKGLDQGALQRRDENCTSDFIEIFASALEILYPGLKALDKINTEQDLTKNPNGQSNN